MHLQLNLYPTHLGGLDGWPPVCAAVAQRQITVLWMICKKNEKKKTLW